MVDGVASHLKMKLDMNNLIAKAISYLRFLYYNFTKHHQMQNTHPHIEIAFRFLLGEKLFHSMIDAIFVVIYLTFLLIKWNNVFFLMEHQIQRYILNSAHTLYIG